MYWITRDLVNMQNLRGQDGNFIFPISSQRMVCGPHFEWKWKLLSHVWLCDPRDYSLPGSSVHGILQARILAWVAVSFSRGSSQPSDWTQASHIAGGLFTVWATRAGPKASFLTWSALSPTTGGKQLTQSEYYMRTQGLRVFWLLDLEWVETG